MKNLLVVVLLLLLPLTACDSGDGGPSCLDPGQVTFGAEQGVDLCTGEKLDGSHATDLWAVDDGGKLSFMSGGSSATHPRPVNWLNPGGIQKTYDSLADVPAELPDTSQDGITLKKAKERGGFVLMRADGSWVRGWFSSLTPSSVTLQFGPLPSDGETSNP